MPMKGILITYMPVRYTPMRYTPVYYGFAHLRSWRCGLSIGLAHPQIVFFVP
jgi:hypothetical protein